jgi:O-antigen/teichoic acid export membrane protein
LGKALIGESTAAVFFTIAALSLPLTGPGLVLLSWLRCQRRVWATVYYTAGYTIANVVLTLIFVAWFRQGVAGILIAQVLTAGVRTLVAIVMMGDWLHPRHFRWHLLRQMLTFSMPLVPAGVALWTLTLASRYFLKFFGSTAEVGLYQVGASLAAFVALAVSAFTQAWPPFALSIHKEPNAKSVYAFAFLGYTWFACLFATAVTLLAPEVLRLLTRPAYYAAAPVVGLLTLGWVMEGHYYVASIGPTLMRKTGPVGTAVGLAAVITVILNVLLIPKWGMLGAAAAYMLAYSARAAYLYWCAQRMYRIPYRFGPALVMVAVAAAVMYVGSLLQGFSAITLLALKMAMLSVFLPLPFILKIVSPAQARRLITPILAMADR